MTKRATNRKMKLTMVRNTTNGSDQIGCRATGIYKGHYIERTAWQPVELFGSDSFRELELLASGHYKKETREIDTKLITNQNN